MGKTLKDTQFVEINHEKNTITGPLEEKVEFPKPDGVSQIHVAVITLDMKLAGEPIPIGQLFYEVGEITQDGDGNFVFIFKATMGGNENTDWIPYVLLEVLCFG